MMTTGERENKMSSDRGGVDHDDNVDGGLHHHHYHRHHHHHQSLSSVEAPDFASNVMRSSRSEHTNITTKTNCDYHNSRTGGLRRQSTITNTTATATMKHLLLFWMSCCWVFTTQLVVMVEAKTATKTADTTFAEPQRINSSSRVGKELVAAPVGQLRGGNHGQDSDMSSWMMRSLLDVFDIAAAGDDKTGSGLPVELDVASPTTETTDPSPSPSPDKMRQSGNPLIQQSLPVAFALNLSILPTTARETLLTTLETTFEDYLTFRYQNLIQLQAAVFGSQAASSMKLQKVDLTMSILDDDTNNAVRRARRLQQSSDQIEIQGVGVIDYTLEVDGSNPTPNEVRDTWNAVFEEEVMTRARVEEVISNAGFDSVLRVEQVTILDPSDVVIVVDDDTDRTSSSSEGNTANVVASDNNNNINDNNGELTRPSTLSIVFGFLLVVIATIGLLAYAYIFYKKRQKRLRKKRMMQETISYPSASVAARPSSVAGASTSFSSASNTIRAANITGGNNSSMMSNQNGMSLPPVLPTNPMIVSRDEEEYSAETSYRGLEGSLGSEDPSDSFAKELQLAASLDQQAWDEFQKRKEAYDRNRKLEPVEAQNNGLGGRGLHGVQEETKTSVSASRHFVGTGDGDEGGTGEQEGSVEASLGGKISFVRSFPYGDEPADFDDRVTDVAPWERYSAALSSSPNVSGIAEEKKDDLSPTSFFAEKLQAIESDLTRLNNTQQRHRQSADDASESDVVSEVEELTKYVRRYERKRDRRLQRENRLKAARSGGFSIGMDGRVISNSDQPDQAFTINNSNSSSLSPPSVQAGEREDPPAAGYGFTGAGPNKMYSRQRTERRSLDYNGDYISDTEGSEEGTYEEPGSEHSRRLGISPFKTSAPDHRYLSASRSLSSNKSRLSDLRNTDAIIDSSQSDVNVNISYDRDHMKAAMKAVPQIQPVTVSESRRVSRVSTIPEVDTGPRVKETKNKHFNKLRGLFEQRTNEQPEPIYPPTEHWQYGIRRNEAR